MSIASFERFPLLFGPAPVHPLARLTKHLGGASVWAKRDDLLMVSRWARSIRMGATGVLPPTCTNGASRVTHWMPRSRLATSAQRPTVNQFLHALGIWSASGRITPSGRSSRTSPPGTLNSNAKFTLSLAARFR